MKWESEEWRLFLRVRPESQLKTLLNLSTIGASARAGPDSIEVGTEGKKKTELGEPVL